MQRIYRLIIALISMLVLLTGVVVVIGYNVYVLKSDAEIGRGTDEGFVVYMRNCIVGDTEDRCREFWRWMSPDGRFQYTEAGRQAQAKLREKLAAEDKRFEELCRARGKSNDPECKILLRVEERKKENANSLNKE